MIFVDNLTRSDKWYLGNAARLIFAPPFPLWLHKPGFWDKAHYYNLEIEPVFTWTLLDDDGREIELSQIQHEWNPARSIDEYSCALPQLRIHESKYCAPDDTLVSQINFRNRSKKILRFHLLLWTIQPSFPSAGTAWISDLRFDAGRFLFTRYYQSNKPFLRVSCALGMSGRVRSHFGILSEASVQQPHWKFTPFQEKFVRGKLPNTIPTSGGVSDGTLFIALHGAITIPPHGSVERICTFHIDGDSVRQKKSRNAISAVRNVFSLRSQEQHWQKYFSAVPHFECSDPYISHYYWYRWYGLRLNTIQPNSGQYKHPVVCEGIGYFRAPISYSAMCHMYENRWMHDPTLARASLLTFLDNQRADGGFRGYIDPHYYRQEMFYHANWGRALRAVDQIHPDNKFLRVAYEGLKRYAEYFDRERDHEQSGLYDIQNHYETGQEYMHRYIAVHPNADQDHWGDVFRLKGVDVTVYLYELKRALADVAMKLRLGSKEIDRWNSGAEQIKQAILNRMWDGKEEMFFDVDPADGKRTNVKAAVCFYPYMTDIVSEQHLRGLKKHLLNPKEFWTKYPVPSSSLDDPYFSADATWKNARMNCPWNGRTWLMTNSHIAEALATMAIRFHDRSLRERTSEFITRFIHLLFFDHDPERPNSFEHYNPLTGAPSVYRGIDDYQHSWIVDLIIKYLAGVRPEGDSLAIDPFPFQVEEFLLDRLPFRGSMIKVEKRKGFFRVWIDGKKYWESKLR